MNSSRASAEEYGPLLLLDTAGCDMEEGTQEGSDSRLNEGEAAVALAHAGRLVDLGVLPGDVGIITPYSAQVILEAAFRCSARVGG